jgi:hypothetical protein
MSFSSTMVSVMFSEWVCDRYLECLERLERSMGVEEVVASKREFAGVVGVD